MVAVEVEVAVAVVVVAVVAAAVVEQWREIYNYQVYFNATPFV